MSKPVYGYLAAITSTAIWSGNFIIARALSGTIPPVALATLRWSVAVLVFAPFAMKSLIEDFPVIRKHLPYLAVVSALGVTLFNTLVYLAGRTTTALNISMISILFPVFIIVISRIFLGERISGRKTIGVLIVFSGAVLLITRGNPAAILELRPARGDLWMLLAAFSWAIYSILLKRRPEGIRPMSLQFASFITGLFFLLPFYLAGRIGRSAVPFSWDVAGAVAYIGILASLTAFVTWNIAVSTLGPVRAGMVYYTMPLFSAVLAVVILGEQIRPFHFVSMGVIAAGIFLVNYRGGNSDRKNAEGM